MHVVYGHTLPDHVPNRLTHTLPSWYKFGFNRSEQYEM